MQLNIPISSIREGFQKMWLLSLSGGGVSEGHFWGLKMIFKQFLSVFTFSRGKKTFFQKCSKNGQVYKKRKYFYHYLGGVRPQSAKNHFFYTVVNASWCQLMLVSIYKTGIYFMLVSLILTINMKTSTNILGQFICQGPKDP